MTPRNLGLLGALVAALSWGGMFPILASLLQQLDPYWLTSIRYGAAASVLLLILLCVEGPKAFRLEGRGWKLFGLGTSGIAVFNILVLGGIKLSGAEHGALIVAMAPLLTAIVLWMRFGNRPTPVTMACIAAAFGGIVLVATRGNLTNILGGSGIGDLEILLGVLGISVYTIGSGTFRDWSWLRYTCLSIAFGALSTIAVTLLATAAGAAHVPTTLSASNVFGMLYMIAIAGVLAFIGWNLAVAKAGAQSTILFSNIVPVVTFAIEILYGRRFGVLEYTGAALTILALVANNLAARAPAISRSPRKRESLRGVRSRMRST